MMIAVEELLFKEEPDMVLVYGDTNSTVAGGLAAVKMQIPLGHIEAGLRSYNRSMPEEINRVLVDHVSTLLFAPTSRSIENLKKEGIVEGVHLTGDVMYDLATRMLSDNRDRIVLEKYKLDSKNYLLVTVHRPINTDNKENLQSILGALQKSGKPVLFPAHPRTSNAMVEYGISLPKEGNIRLVQPLDYLEFISLLKNAEKVVTDSGGVQKEAYFLGTPCVTLRDETEWPETVETGWNILVGSKMENILKGITMHKLTDSKPTGFGDGSASEKISRLVAGFSKRK